MLSACYALMETLSRVGCSLQMVYMDIDMLYDSVESLDWTTGLDYWITGLDYWTTGVDYWIHPTVKYTSFSGVDTITGLDYWTHPNCKIHIVQWRIEAEHRHFIHSVTSLTLLPTVSFLSFWKS